MKALRLSDSSVLTVIATWVYMCISVTTGQELNFYDDDGNVFTLTINGGCYNFKPKWDKRSTAIEADDGCYNVWDKHDCRGGQLRVQRSQKIQQLKTVNFDKSISSVNLCSPAEAEEQKKTHASMIEVKNGGYRPKMSASSLQEVRTIAVEEHNKYRSKHGVPPLSGDDELHEEAQKYAEHLAATHRFEPSRTFRYGENLATSFRRNQVDAVKDAIGRWYDKIKNYDFNRPGYNVDGKPSGSFSAVVWRNTTKLGIGISWDEQEEGYVIVAFYEPQGLHQRLSKSDLSELSEVYKLEGANSGKTCHLQFTEHIHSVFTAFILLGLFNSFLCSDWFQGL